MGHLQRIILIHTHLEGVVEFELDADANICGDNAAGKTTLQRLIPVFYGEQPRNVVPRTRKSFDEFYLPTDRSYLVYEYQREAGDTCMVIVTRHASSSVEYRFAKGAYQPEYFLEDTDGGVRGVAYGEIATRLRRHGVDVGRKIDSTSEYRSIILNDMAQLRGRNRESQELRQQAMKFSLVKPEHRLRHMEKLVSAVHAKEGKMDTLKTMLAAIFEEDGVELPVTHLRNQEARQWISRMRQSLGLQRLNDAFAQCEQLSQALGETEAQLWQLQPLLREDANTQERTNADAAKQLQHIERELNALQETYQEESAQLNEKKLHDEQALASVSTQLNDIQQRYDEYLEQDMDALANAMAQLPSWREEHSLQTEHVRVLTSGYEDIKHQYDSHRSQVLEAYSAFQQESSERIAARRDNMDSLQAQHAQQRDTLTENYHARRETALANFSHSEASLQQQLSEVHTRLQASLLTPAELESEQEASQRIERMQQGFQAALQAENSASNALQQAKQAHQTALQIFQQGSQQRAQREQQLYRLQRQKDPANGTLRHFLRGNQPGWEQHLGKIIREDLLDRADLAPEHTDEGTSFAGLTLALNRIDTPEFALEEYALDKAIAEASTALAQAEQAETEQEDAARAAEQLVAQNNAAVETAKRATQQAEQEVEYAKNARDMLQQEHRAKAQQRRKEWLAKQEALETRQETIAAEKAERLAELKQDYQQKHLELKADNGEALQRERDSIQDIEQQLLRRKADDDARLAELKQHFYEQLESKGVDHQQIKQAQAKLDDITQRIANTEKRRDELSEYQQFMRTEWQLTKPQLVDREAALQESVRVNAAALATCKQQYDTRRKAQRAERQEWRQAQKESAEHLQALNQLLTQLSNLVEPTQAVPEAENNAFGDQAERIERGRNGLQQRAEQEERLRKAVQQFDLELTQGADADFVTHLHQQLNKAEQEQGDSVLVKLPIYAGMLQLLRSKQEELLLQGRNIGGDLSKFFTVFRNLNRQIHAQSRKLSDEVAHEMNLDGITRAEVKIESTIDQLDFWEPLKTFFALHHQWEESGERLPSEAYLNALAAVAELLRQDQQFQFENLLQLELHLTENGNNLIIRNDRQLLESSSHGMAYLILCQFLLAFTRLLRGNAQVKIHWPIDEIGTLAYRNVEQLFRACAKNNILILGAFPNPESDVLTLFEHRYLIEKERNSERRHLKRIEPQLSPLAAKLQAHMEERA